MSVRPGKLELILIGYSLRMTISQLLECLLGKECAITGKYGDATPFSSSSTDIVDTLIKNLEKCGYDGTGYEDMYDGATGEKYLSQIFFGPTYYHKLKHMVSDKIYARGYGSAQALTRQPGQGLTRQPCLLSGLSSIIKILLVIKKIVSIKMKIIFIDL